MQIGQVIFQRYHTFLRYAVVGVSGTFIDLFSLYLMTEISGMNPQSDPRFYILVSIAFLLAVVNNYTWNRIWTFKSKEPNIQRQFSKFFLVSMGGYILTQVFMWMFIRMAGMWYLLAKAMTSVLVLIWNFILNRMWTFKVDPFLVEEQAEENTALVPTRACELAQSQ